jgi:diaminopimelate decarboxylase
MMATTDTLVRDSKRLIKKALGQLLGSSGGGARVADPEYWGLEVTPSGALALEGVVLHELAGRAGSPLHIVSAARLRMNGARFLAPPTGRGTGCEVFYSYKTNPIPRVLTELHGVGVGAEVTSAYELWLSRQLGVAPDKIVFNGPAKSRTAIREAIEAGIQLININHREEIAVIAGIGRDVGRKPRVGIRVAVTQTWGGQFGIPLEHGRALAAYQEALNCPDLDVVAVHAHRGGMIRSEDELDAFVRPVLAFTNELYTRFGLALEIVDFGGGLAIPTVASLPARDLAFNRRFGRDLRPPEVKSALSIEAYVARLAGLVEEFFAGVGRPRPRIFVEPGRAISGDAQMLLGTVLTIKDGGDRRFAIMDAGINLAESCRNEYHQLFSANHYGRRADAVYTVVGPICTGADTLYWAARLPALDTGDSLLIMDAGAYFVPFATSFSCPQPPIVMIDQGQVTQIRRGERFEDRVQFDACFPASERGAADATRRS